MDYDPKTEKSDGATAAPKPHSRRRIVAISLLAVIALAAIFVIVAWFAGCGATERYVAGLDISRTSPVGITAEKHIEEGYAELNVTGKTELKILQLSDIHFGCGIFSLSEDKKLADELIKCVKAVNPDFIAITGDALSPIFVTSAITTAKARRARDTSPKSSKPRRILSLCAERRPRTRKAITILR